MFVNIPFCCLPNSKFQRVDLSACKRTEVQVRQVEWISNLPEFGYFIMAFITPTPIVFTPECSGTVDVTWYSVDGVYNHTRITEQGAIHLATHEFLNHQAPFDHPVYTSRTY